MTGDTGVLCHRPTQKKEGRKEKAGLYVSVYIFHVVGYRTVE